MAGGKKRIRDALAHREPDRVPVDFGAHRSSGIMGIAYSKFRAYLGLPKVSIRIYDMPQQLAVIDDDVLDLLSIDSVELDRVFTDDPADWKPWILPDETPCLIPSWIHPVRDEAHTWRVYSSGTALAEQRKGMVYFDMVHWPLKDCDDDSWDLSDALEHVMWTAPGMCAPPGSVSLDAESGFTRYREGARKLRESADRAIIGFFGGSLFELGQWLFGMEQFYYMLAADRDRVETYLQQVTDLHMRRLETYLAAVGPYIDIIAFSDDYGMQTSSQISPTMFSSIFKPFHRRLWNRAKELADVSVMLHSCGAVTALLDDMIDAGLDAINPVQITAAGMDPKRLKTQFGSRLTFWGGGCDTQYVLGSASPEEVRSHVLSNLEILAPNGGFVFQQVHNIMADVPPENILAMFNAVREYNGLDILQP